MEIHTRLGEIIGFLKQLKDEVSADSHHASIDAAKKQDIVEQDIVAVTIQTNLRQGETEEKEEVVTLTATIQTNLRQCEAEEKEKVTTETESNEANSGRVISRPKSRRRRRATRRCRSGRRSND